MADYPHCNAETLHTPGACYYCDQFPQRQRGREVSGVPFSPEAANGWSGNVAVKAAEVHSHMGASYVVGETPDATDPGPCRIEFRRGWRCTRRRHLTGPCALLPTWWNLPARWKWRAR